MKKVTRLKDLAEGLNVSITTVSKALNDHPDISPKRKKEILDYAKKMNYMPNQVARSFRQQKTKLIGVIFSDNTNPFYARVIRGIEEVMFRHGYHCILMNSYEDVERETQFIDELRGLNVAGVLLTPAAGNGKSTRLLEQYDIPYVLVNRYLEKEKNTYVALDDYQAGYMAAKHLCSYGNENIFFLNFLPEVSSSKGREAGYRQALEDCGVAARAEWIIAGCMNQNDGYEAAKRILEKVKPPVSIMCYSDNIAIGAAGAVQERRYTLPHDVALIGTDDISLLSFLSPRFTTIGVPKMRMGRKGAELLIERIRAKEKADELDEESGWTDQQILMEPELLIRETS
jgi:DNA-binding LacI/PurR family transcriptional regulator